MISSVRLVPTPGTSTIEGSIPSEQEGLPLIGRTELLDRAAVSYTHLDVYKRQLQSFLEQLEQLAPTHEKRGCNPEGRLKGIGHRR